MTHFVRDYGKSVSLHAIQEPDPAGELAGASVNRRLAAEELKVLEAKLTHTAPCTLLPLLGQSPDVQEWKIIGRGWKRRRCTPRWGYIDL